MSLFSKLFGGKGTPEVEPELYKGFRIYPAPQQADGGYLLGARIEKDLDGDTKVHHLIRADRFQSADEVAPYAILKAKQVIDEQGDRLFG
ncbi:hypothetical protein roselon_01786 [Roseibacterium elongatum DSM 19469]|uniref:Transcriptional activator HlyU n=1 Tax=Roseicyclus elongatus DSM 19469 TaxID=1294273 RepID=W8S1U6_9RHOB|nr:HlyU family transcriptional regulator [Roseibacterium elongatum]AHM04152.1 hypothetical protein roselon_01786 [Roseibacterium elongatum DSM 19469]